MNRQGTPANPFGGIEWTHIRGPRTGYTANPIRGCKHGCQWEMPDGKLAMCYAKAIAERLATKAYPNGFEAISYHPEELRAIRDLPSPAGIFIDSMSDLFGQGVKREWINKVIETIRDRPDHIFFSLTKNPSRFRDFAHDALWPKNWFVGISVPPTIMFGKRLTEDQQRRWLSRALYWLSNSPAVNRWISIEPLSFDCGPVLRRWCWDLDWAVIGAASNGSATYQPDPMHLHSVLRNLPDVPIFYKGNMDRAALSAVHLDWLQEFPPVLEARVI